MKRRDFLQTVALGAAVTWRGQAAETWFDRPMRWAQLTLVEDDPGTFDPDFWLDYFRRTHSDAVCLSAGGCVAFYPTKVPLHYPSKWLKDSDPFGYLANGCRKMGMNILARTDPHATHQDTVDAHPDWIAVDAKGEKRRHWADPDFWVTCALGPYNFEFMTAVTKEIVNLYRVDGVFSNRWAGSGMCYCQHCVENFRAAAGRELPRTTNPQDPAQRDYIIWRQKRLFEVWTLWDDSIRKINPRAVFIANSGGGALSSLNMKTIGDRAPIMFADRQARSGLNPIWTNGKNAKEYRATMGRKPIGGIMSVGVEEAYRWKDSVQDGHEIQAWMTDGVANGLRPWFTKFGGVLRDRRWLKPVEEFYQWHYENERYLRNEAPVARVAMVYSQHTAQFYGGDKARAKVEDHTLGFYQALVESRIPFEMVHEENLDAPQVDRFRTLILPNLAALSDRQCGQLREFVGRGGRLVATYETSLYNEWGVRRADFGLADLFGASYGGKLEGPMQNSYLNIEKEPGGGYHPLLAGLEDAGRIINGVHRVVTRGAEGRSPLTLVPSYPDLPMEEVYPRVAHTNTPGLFARQVGRGRVVYFPWDVDRTFWELLNTDHLHLLRNAVVWATDEEPVVTVECAGMVDLAVWKQKQSMTVHLVNLTNPMMLKGPVRQVTPMGPVQVSLQIPAGARVSKVHTLVSRGDMPHRMEAGRMVCRVGLVGLHEVIAVDLV